jgi:hypothetical protein
VKFCFQDEEGNALLSTTLCFTCCEWRFDSPAGQVVEDFDSARLRLERLVMELFPDQPVSCK